MCVMLAHNSVLAPDSLGVCWVLCCVAALLELKGYLDPAGNVLKDWAPTQVAPESRVAVTSHCTWTYVACDDNNNVIRWVGGWGPGSVQLLRHSTVCGTLKP